MENIIVYEITPFATFWRWAAVAITFVSLYIWTVIESRKKVRKAAVLQTLSIWASIRESWILGMISVVLVLYSVVNLSRTVLLPPIVKTGVISEMTQSRGRYATSRLVLLPDRLELEVPVEVYRQVGIGYCITITYIPDLFNSPEILKVEKRSSVYCN
jgi:hypothetical protein